MALTLKLAVLLGAVLVNLIPAEAGKMLTDGRYLTERDLNRLRGQEMRNVIRNSLKEKMGDLNEVKRGVAGPSPQNTIYLNELNKVERRHAGESILGSRNLNKVDEVERGYAGESPLGTMKLNKLDEVERRHAGKSPLGTRNLKNVDPVKRAYAGESPLGTMNLNKLDEENMVLAENQTPVEMKTMVARQGFEWPVGYLSNQ